MAWASSTETASGFSQKTWQPASIAALAYGPWVSGYVLMLTTSGFVAASASSYWLNSGSPPSSVLSAPRDAAPRLTRPTISNSGIR